MIRNKVKQRVLIFHPALAPYRVDFFNELGKHVELRVVFMTRNNANQAFDQKQLLKDVTYSYGYLDKHIKFMKRNLNFGYVREIDSFKPDIVICNEFGVSLWATWWKNLFLKYRFKIYTICDDSCDVFYNRKGLRKIVSRFFSRKINGVVTVNPDVAKLYKDVGTRSVLFFPIINRDSSYKDKLKKSLQITNSYIDKFNLTGKKCFFFVGRLTEVKNLNTLISTFSKTITECGDPLKLILIGDGHLREELKQLSKSYGVSDHVLMPGRYEGLELFAWYNIDGVFVLPSIYEPFGAVVAEALMAGMPAIVSSFAGAKCLVNGNNGMICDPNEMSLSKTMNSIVSQMKPVRNINEIKSSLLPYKFDIIMERFLTELKK